MDKKVLAYSYEFQEMFLSKDIFLIPYFVAKSLGIPLNYRYVRNLGNTDIPKEHRKMILSRVPIKYDFLAMIVSVLFSAKSIEVLFLNGSSAIHMIVVRLFKLLNPKGNIIVFGDMEAPQARELNANGFQYSSGLSGFAKRCLTDFFMNNVTYLVANTEAFGYMKELCDRKGWKGLLHFYPCIDDERCEEYGIVRRSWEEKENIMVCVGRIGNYQKNTEMLLDAFKKIDLKDWKIYMIGPITSSFDLNERGDFQKKIDNFYADYPQYVNHLFFTGMIYDQNAVLDYYNKSKVLLMTSRHESWGNVYSEAAAFGCYIISTEVGGARLCSNNWKFGTKVDQEDANGLATVLQNFVDGKINVCTENSLSMQSLSYNTMISSVLLPNMFSLD